MMVHETTKHPRSTERQISPINKPAVPQGRTMTAARVGSGPAVGYDFSQVAIVYGGDEAPVTAPTPAETTTETATTTPETPAAPTDTTETTPATPSETPAPAAEPAEAAPAAPTLSWEFVKRHKWDALWWFNGEHPSGFSITARLRATGFGDATLLNWSIVRGSDKVAFQGAATGAEVTLESKKGSARLNDIDISVQEGTAAGAPSYTGQFTVRAPNRLIHRSDTDHAACPPWGGCGAACTAYWTEIDYRIVDNVGGTIVGATVNENFPGAKTNDQANNWPNPAAFATVPFWENTNGTFVDNWFVACGNPAPVAPTAANANTGVDQLPHEFYVGSKTPAKGVRVQTHTAHRRLGFARHEGITTPAP